MTEIGFGLWMTAMGMGTVFSMLAFLMLLLMGIGRLDVRRKTPAAAVEAPGETGGCREIDVRETGGHETGARETEIYETGACETGARGLSPESVAAITVAVLTHVRIRRGQAAPEMRHVRPGSRLFASRWVAVGRAHQNKPST